MAVVTQHTTLSSLPDGTVISTTPGDGGLVQVIQGAVTTTPPAATLVVSTLSTANTALTVNLPLVALQFHYISRIEIVRVATATVAGTAILDYTSANLPGSWARSTGNAIAIGTTVKDVDECLGTELRSTAAGTITSIIAPAAGAGVQVRITVYYRVGA